MSVLDKALSLVTARDGMRKERHHPTDHAVVRVDLNGSESGFTARDGVTYFDGDERVMTPDEYAPYEKNLKHAPFVVLGWIPAPKPPAIEGPARTIRARAGNPLTPPSKHLGRTISGGEVVELPSVEARRYVRSGEATYTPAGARAELTEALALLATGTDPDAATAVVTALDDTLRAYGIHMPAARDA